MEATDRAPDGDYEMVYEEPDLSRGVEGVDYRIVYGADNNEAEEQCLTLDILEPSSVVAYLNKLLSSV